MEQQKTGHEQQKKRLLLQARLATLTARENAIFEIIMKGYSNKEIARQFSLSPRTVEAHRANIFAKLEVNSLPKLLNTYGEITLLKND